MSGSVCCNSTLNEAERCVCESIMTMLDEGKAAAAVYKNYRASFQPSLTFTSFLSIVFIRFALSKEYFFTQ